jgi:hypothetical protein
LSLGLQRGRRRVGGCCCCGDGGGGGVGGGAGGGGDEAEPAIEGGLRAEDEGGARVRGRARGVELGEVGAQVVGEVIGEVGRGVEDVLGGSRVALEGGVGEEAAEEP